LNLVLENYDIENPGFLEITVTADRLLIENFAVPFDGGAEAIHRNDFVEVNVQQKIVSQQPKP
jgi:hypothetical protein